MTTPEEAVAALEQLRATVDVAELIDVAPTGATGAFFARSVGVSASPPDCLEHFILINVPTRTDVSLIARKFNRVRIVDELVDLPGAAGCEPDLRLGPRG
jgi:hypothetical protein